MRELVTDKFKLIGGHPALDFVNTVGGRIEDGSDCGYSVWSDKLAEVADLASWSVKAGFLTADEADSLLNTLTKDPSAAKKMLKKAIEIREVLYRIFKAVIEKRVPEPKDLTIFNNELLAARKSESLSYKDGGFSWTWNDSPVERVLWIVMRSAADLLASDALSKVGQCGGPECRWLFLDESRRHNRQWCDMKDCGNLAKVRRFRNRKAAI